MRCCSVLWSFSPVLVLVAACGTDAPVPEEPVTRLDLRAAMGLAEVAPVGITVEPNSGRRFLFDAQAGLYEVLEDGTALAVMPMAEIPDPGVPIRMPFTDVVSLGDDEFALTAIGDGFVLDLTEPRLSLRFCYEPGFFPEEWEQRTNGVGYDPTTDRIYAQPQTYNPETGEVVFSQIGVYDRRTGADLEWYEIADRDFLAGGLTLVPGAGLILGSGSSLHQYDFTAHALRRARDLRGFGIVSIAGLAVDLAANTLLVADDNRGELVEIELEALGL